MLLADRSAARSIVAYKHDEDKLLPLDQYKLLGQAGPQGDRSAFGEYVQKNIALYNLRTGLTLNSWATASWIRNQLAEALRQGHVYLSLLLAVWLLHYITRTCQYTNICTSINIPPLQRLNRPFQVNILLAGYDATGDKQGSHLYYMDYLGSLHPVNIGAQGYASNFTYSILDRYWHEDITMDDGKEILRKCINELHQRFLINLPEFLVKVITKDGIKEVKL